MKVEVEKNLFFRIFTSSASHNLAAFSMPGHRVEPTPGYRYRPCDVAVVFGAFNPTLNGSRAALRNDVYTRHKGPLLVVESSIIGRVFLPPEGQWLKRLFGLHRKPRNHHPFFRLALNAAFGPEADFNNTHSPPDRWERLNIQLKSFRKAGDHILLIGQTPDDASLGGRDIVDWLVDTAKEIRRHSKRPILVRFHPNMDYSHANSARSRLRLIADVHFAARNMLLSDNLSGAWASVSLSSGAAIESLISGVPAVTLSSDSLAYDVTSHDLAMIDHPPESSREQWLFDLAYAQWSPEEYADGTAWRHIAPAVGRALIQETKRPQP